MRSNLSITAVLLLFLSTVSAHGQEPTAMPPVSPIRNTNRTGTAPPASAPNYIASGSVLLSVSKNGDAIWGFSMALGKWTKQEIKPAAKSKLTPLLSENLAGLQVGNTIYAYSEQTGRWDTLRLPAERKLRMSVDSDMVLVTDGNNIYVFANSTGRWSSRDAATTTTADTGQTATQLKIFHFVHADVQLLTVTLRQLFGNVTLTTDQRMNAIIARGPAGDLAELEAVALKLDEASPDQPSVRSARDAKEPVLGHVRTGAPLCSTTLRKQYDELEQQAAQLAAQYRKPPPNTNRTPDDAEALKQQLIDAVSKAFAARQRLQRAELDALRQRLQRIEQQIGARERIKNAIINHRVKELLDPDLAWAPKHLPAAAPTPVRGTRTENPLPPLETSVGRVQIRMTFFEATPDAAKELGGQYQPTSSGNVFYRPAREDFWKKLQTLVRAGQVKTVAEPSFAVDLNSIYDRSSSIALNDPPVQLELKYIASRPNELFGEIRGLAVPDQPPRPGTAAFQTTFGQPTVFGPFACATKGRRTFVYFEATLDKRAFSAPRAFGAPPATQDTQTSAPDTKRAIETESLILRSAEEFARGFDARGAELKRVTQLEDKGVVNAAMVESARRNLAVLRAEYAAQIRLLEIEVQKSEIAATSAAQKRELLTSLYHSNAISQMEMADAQRDADVAQLNVTRARTLLELYRKAGQNEPVQRKPDQPKSRY